MQKTKALVSGIAILAMLFSNILPVFALGELPPPPVATMPVVITPPVDTTPPAISGVVTSNVLPTGATIAWTVNELSTFGFEYGTTTSYGSQAALGAGAALAGTAVLTGLSSSTPYHYCIHATDAAANTSESCGSFTTSTPPDTTPPVISAAIVASITVSSAAITWTTNETATSQVEYGTSSEYGSWSSADTTLALSHSVSLSDLSPNTTYHYRITSTDANGNVAVSADATFITSALPVQSGAGATVTVTDTTPPIILDISAVSLEPHNATILWTTDELATSTLEYGTSTNYGSHATLSTDALLSHSATLLGLAPATKYYYCIHATDVAGNATSSCSSANSFTTAAQQVTLDTLPPAVSLVTVGSIHETSATVTWTVDELSQGYVEYGTTDGYGSETQLESDFSLSHAALLSNLSAGTAYHYRVHTRDAAGNAVVTPDNTFTTVSVSVTIAPPVQITLPPVISGLSITPTSETSEAIGWTTDQPAVSTLRYGTTVDYGSNATLSVSAVVGGTVALTGLQPATTYYFCITATNTVNQSSSECGHSFTTLSVPLPPPTVNIVVVSSVSSSRATIGFSTNEVTSAEVEYGLTSNYGSTSELDEDFTLVHHIVLLNLQPNATYHYRVKVTNGSENTTTTSDGTFTTQALAAGQTTPPDATPPTITLVTVASVSPTSAEVSWTTNEPSTSQVNYGASSSYGSSTPHSTALDFIHNAAISGLAPNTTYHYQIVSADANGNAATTSDATFTTESVVVQQPQDTTPPIISQVAAAELLSHTATITWDTNEPARSTLEYGTSTNYGLSATIPSSALLAHDATLTNLTPGTSYYYCVHAADLAGNMASSCNHWFMTAPAETTIQNPLTQPVSVSLPVISFLEADSIGQDSARITWITNIASDSRVEYGDTTNFGQSIFDAAKVTEHSLVLSQLSPDTTYNFRAISTLGGTNASQTVSNVSDLTTLAHPVIIDPAANILSAHVSNVTSSTASVAWTTDEATTGIVEYGTTSSYGQSTDEQSSLASHEALLHNLVSHTAYHFRIKAVDQADNITYSIDGTFITLAVPGTTPGGEPQPSSNENAAPTIATGGGGGGGGGVSYEIVTSSVPSPAVVSVAPADSQTMFIWNNPSVSGFSGNLIIRKEGGYPTSPTDGQVLYKGNATTFTDTNLQNGKSYYYAMYSYGSNGYSTPARFTSLPAAGITQVQLDENPVLESDLPGEHFTADITEGTKSLEVEHLQQILNVAGVHGSKLTTGYFGSRTKAALKKFQAKYGLAQTGIADRQTRAVLNSISQGWTVEGAPTDIAVLNHDLQVGDTSDEVANLQEFLAYEGSYTKPYITGYYGASTQKAVAAFQKKYGVTPVSGYVGYKTRHTIQTVLGM